MSETSETYFGAINPCRIEGEAYGAGDPVDRDQHGNRAIQRLERQGYLGEISGETTPDDEPGDTETVTTPAPDANRMDAETGRPALPQPGVSDDEGDTGDD